MVTLAGAGAGASTKGPKRPPTKPVKGTAGTIGIGYWTFPNRLTNQTPANGIGGRVTLDGNITGSVIFEPVLDFATTAQGFSKGMSAKGWKTGFHKFDNTLQAQEVRRADLGIGGSNIFNTVNIGLFMSHGNFGTTIDFTPTASQSKQTYFPAGGTNPPNTWIRCSEFRFGDNLRWMGLLACNGLQEDAYQSMYLKQVLPIGDPNQSFDQLHLLCGAGSYSAVGPSFGGYWAKNMVGGAFSSPQTIADAWFNAGKKQYSGQPATGIFTNAITFKVIGWDTTLGDRVNSYTEPDPSIDLLQDVNEFVYP